MPRIFRYVIKDNDNMTFDVLGPISNDTEYDKLVTDAQKNGFAINSCSADIACPEMEVCAVFEGYGFRRDRELFEKVRKMRISGCRLDR